MARRRHTSVASFISAACKGPQGRRCQMTRLGYARSMMSSPTPDRINIVWIKPRSIRCDLTTKLFRSQPDGSQLTYRDCRWAVDKCQKLLGSRLTVADLDRLGSHLSMPLWLLASAQ